MVQVQALERKLCVYFIDHFTGVRDYIHIMDLAEGHAAAIKVLLKEKGNAGIFKAYNLGTGSGSSVLQVAFVAFQLWRIQRMGPLLLEINFNNPFLCC